MRTPNIRPFVEGDLPRVLDTLRAALGEPPGLRRTPELFRWKHLDNPFGPSLMLVAEEHGRIAGFRAFMRWRLTSPSGEVLDCVRAVDTATHPDFQRRGIFRLLTEAAVDLARAEGIDLIFNTPNPRSGAGYLKMGWSEVGHIGAFVRPRLRPGRGDGAQAELRTIPDDRRPVGLRTPRTEAYLRWRYTGHPTARYRFVYDADSLAVLRDNVRGGRAETIVSDVLGPRPRQALVRTRRMGTGLYDAAWFSRRTPERRAALTAGFIPTPAKTLRLVARPLRPLPIDVTDLGAWDLAIGDLELL